jgi:hypothetical protein
MVSQYKFHTSQFHFFHCSHLHPQATTWPSLCPPCRSLRYVALDLALPARAFFARSLASRARLNAASPRSPIYGGGTAASAVSTDSHSVDRLRTPHPLLFSRAARATWPSSTHAEDFRHRGRHLFVVVSRTGGDDIHASAPIVCLMALTLRRYALGRWRPKTSRCRNPS